MLVHSLKSRFSYRLLYWAGHISSSTDAVKNYLINMALDQYDESVAIEMGDLVDRLSEEAAREAERLGLDLTNGETRDVPAAMQLIGTFADKFY